MLHRLIAGMAVLLAGCGAGAAVQAPPPTRIVPPLLPTITASAPAMTVAQPAVTPPVPGDGWQSARPGLELRHLQIIVAPDRPAVPLVIVRLDPSRVRLRVLYAPDRPRALASWFADQRPLVAINGGFFTQEYQTTALLISDGTASGQSYTGFGGMLAVTPDGAVSLRPLRDQPYDSGETLAQALQSFPMLVFPGGAPASFDDNGQRARRTVVAIDRAGRLLIVISSTSSLTLHDMSNWLRQSDLEIDRALNLDGGPSTGLYLSDGPLKEQIDSLGPLPIVLLVEPK
jgi:uncharacterized protein YigE (DUF2233 family)